jgi:hypothetical protein
LYHLISAHWSSRIGVDNLIQCTFQLVSYKNNRWTSQILPFAFCVQDPVSIILNTQFVDKFLIVSATSTCRFQVSGRMTMDANNLWYLYPQVDPKVAFPRKAQPKVRISYMYIFRIIFPNYMWSGIFQIWNNIWNWFFYIFFLLNIDIKFYLFRRFQKYFIYCQKWNQLIFSFSLCISIYFSFKIPLFVYLKCLKCWFKKKIILFIHIVL